MKRSQLIYKIISYSILLLGLGIVAIPIWYMVSTAFKPQTMVFELPPQLWPNPSTFDNFIKAVTTDHFGLYFWNSVKVTLTATLLTVLISSMLAYAFARLNFPGKEALFYILLLGMMVPPVMLIIPQFIVSHKLDLYNNLWGLILVYVTMNIAMQTFLLRGVFEDVPRDLEEAAMIDGGSPFTIFTKIVLPLSGPGLAVVVINSFLYSWEEYTWANVNIGDSVNRTLPIGLALFQSEHLTEWGQVFAASLIALIPVVIIFILFQRYFVQGVSTTGIKG
ncbi:MAG: multiple sugar transport system permease protein [Chloroflexi bacterium]|nr:MAG: multiple sugar transport system permease protein [Chloroflexota bacterium]MBA4375935.1 carbohydrate ABC transporter permease [Anaerolinea sp.]